MLVFGRRHWYRLSCSGSFLQASLRRAAAALGAPNTNLNQPFGPARSCYISRDAKANKSHAGSVGITSSEIFLFVVDGRSPLRNISDLETG
jgi:hypothetical protein